MYAKIPKEGGSYNQSIFLPAIVEESCHHNITQLDTTSHVELFYLLQAAIVVLPAFFFIILSFTRADSKKGRQVQSTTNSFSLRDCNVSLMLVVILIFIQLVVFYGMTDMFNNLLTMFAVLGPLHLSKTEGVYLTSAFWAAMCFGRLNGMFIYYIRL